MQHINSSQCGEAEAFLLGFWDKHRAWRGDELGMAKQLLQGKLI
jgi:hypothetical protein